MAEAGYVLLQPQYTTNQQTFSAEADKLFNISKLHPSCCFASDIQHTCAVVHASEMVSTETAWYVCLRIVWTCSLLKNSSDLTTVVHFTILYLEVQNCPCFLISICNFLCLRKWRPECYIYVLITIIIWISISKTTVINFLIAVGDSVFFRISCHCLFFQLLIKKSTWSLFLIGIIAVFHWLYYFAPGLINQIAFTTVDTFLYGTAV